MKRLQWKGDMVKLLILLSKRSPALRLYPKTDAERLFSLARTKEDTILIERLCLKYALPINNDCGEIRRLLPYEHLVSEASSIDENLNRAVMENSDLLMLIFRQVLLLNDRKTFEMCRSVCRNWHTLCNMALEEIKRDFSRKLLSGECEHWFYYNSCPKEYFNQGWDDYHSLRHRWCYGRYKAVICMVGDDLCRCQYPPNQYLKMLGDKKVKQELLGQASQPLVPFDGDAEGQDQISLRMDRTKINQETIASLDRKKRRKERKEKRLNYNEKSLYRK